MDSTDMRPTHLVYAVVIWCGTTLSVTGGTAQQTTPAPSLLPDAPGRALTVKLCGDCHEVGTIIGTRRTPAGWRASIDDMVTLGAVFSDHEIDEILGYLSPHFGHVNVNTASAEDLVLVLGLADAQAAQLVAARRPERPFSSLADLAVVASLDAAFLERHRPRIVFADR
jgi:hypothetical protein